MITTNYENGEVQVYSKKYIAILGCQRFSILMETFAALLKCRDVYEYHLLVFLDRPEKNLESKEFQFIQNFFENNSDCEKFKSFTIHVAKENFGVWSSKLGAFSKSFDMGSDFTILLEDDVLLKPDALTFCSEACNYVLKAKELITVSLYSTNLIHFDNIFFTKALKFVSENQDVFQEWGFRRWPFPWGIGLTKKNYKSLVALGWNGNDQNMGQLLNDANGYDLFPIISRSDHIGKSKQENGNFKVVSHINFQESNYQIRQFQITSETKIEEKIEKTNYFHRNLKNEMMLSDTRIKVIYDDSIFLKQIENFKEKNKFFDVDATYVDQSWLTDIDSIKIYDIIYRISSPITVLLFSSNQLQEFVDSELKNKSTKLLHELNSIQIVEFYQNLT